MCDNIEKICETCKFFLSNRCNVFQGRKTRAKDKACSEYIIGVEVQDLPRIVKDDKVNYPSHYTWLKEKCGIEVIDITRWLDFDVGNAVKYLLRAGYKQEEGYSSKDKTIEDLKKAVWYINDKIKMLEEKV